MAVVIREADGELGAEEKMIALKILLVIYLHDKRYCEALRDIEELLNDPETQNHAEYLLLKREEIRDALARSLNRMKLSLLRRLFNKIEELRKRDAKGFN